MIDAKVLATGPRGSDPITVWGVWIPRRGDNTIFTLEVVGNYSTLLTAELFQKDYADPGDGTSASASTSFNSSTGRQSFTKLGCKEVVRVKLTLEPAGVQSGEVGLVLFRFLQPVWFEAVKV
jgi:hypothetical protein